MLINVWMCMFGCMIDFALNIQALNTDLRLYIF